MEELETISSLSDAALIKSLQNAVIDERHSLSRVIVHLVEFDRRKLYAHEGFPSLFHYCTRKLGYAEAAAYKRIRVARTAIRLPAVLSFLRSGETNLSTLVVLSPHLTEKNYHELLSKARQLTTREIEFLAASMTPKSDLSDTIRRCTAGKAQTTISILKTMSSAAENRIGPSSTYDGAKSPATEIALMAAPRELQKIQPLSGERVRIGFTGSREMLGMLERTKELLRHRYPDGNLEAIFTEALGALLDRIDPKRRLAAKKRRLASRKLKNTGWKRPKSTCKPSLVSRHVPQSIRDEVWHRDQGQCTFVGPGGKRCLARTALEFDHIQPWAHGGLSDNARNIRLLCRAHNQLLARQIFGDDWKLLGRPRSQRPPE